MTTTGSILVTGGAGYIGSHIVRQLVAAGFPVLAVDNLEKGHRAAVPEGVLRQVDLADQAALDKLFASERVAGVIHMAAHSLVGESMACPAKYYRNNLANGLNLLETMQRHGVRRLVFSSSAAVYGEPQQATIPETHPTEPTNTYGETKLAFERMLRWFDEAYGLRYVSLRYFNAAGADPAGDIGEDHDPESHLIPLVFKVALGQTPAIKVFGSDYPTPDGTAIRDYIHVSDLAAAHLLAFDHLLNGGASRVYNLGSEHGFSVLEVIEKARAVTGRPIPVEMAGRRTGDPAVLVASAARARAELGWRPAYASLEAILETAWRWHSGHPQGFGDAGRG
ncbi:MAG: UDP-glucose 4-epimerase GalE [Chitinophagales bacterium]